MVREAEHDEQDEHDLNLSLVLVLALARTTQGLRQRLLPFLAADGLTGGQFDTLKVLYQHGPLCINDLLEKTVTTSGNIDVVLRHLLDKKMVSKTADRHDGRRRIVALTEKGRAYVGKRFPAHVEELRKSLSILSGDEKERLMTLLARLADGLQQSHPRKTVAADR